MNLTQEDNGHGDIVKTQSVDHKDSEAILYGYMLVKIYDNTPSKDNNYVKLH